MTDRLRVPFPSEARRYYQHGWHSWSVAGWRDRHDRLEPIRIMEHRLVANDPAHADDDHPGGAGVGAVELTDGEITLLGALGLDGWVEVEGNELIGTGDCEWMTVTGDEDAVFARFAGQLGHVHGVRSRDPGPVWCSWYGLHRGIDETLLGDVLEGLGSLPFSVIQIDDGWQRSVGDWDPNDDFPSGMAAMADRIRTSGRRAGLWLAPFLVDPDSRLAQDNPEMILKDGDGVPVAAAHSWGGVTYALDVTRHDVTEWLTELVEKVVSEWGFDYLKLDYLYAAALPGRYTNPIGREEAYRRVVVGLRSTLDSFDDIGEDAFLLACGAPILPSIGVFDAIRVGPDTAPFWDNLDRTVHLRDRSGPAAADAIATSLNRWWLRDVITIDSDVVFFRSRYNLLSPRERQLLIDLARVCGMRATSDPPMWLDTDERAELEAFLVESHPVARTGRYRFLIGDREVDFTEVVESRPW